MGKTAWIAGASGLVGGHALEALLGDERIERVVSFGRRELEKSHAKLEQRRIDFAAFDAGDAPAPSVAVCALGTTIKKAGSQGAFRAIDHDAVLAFARAAKERGASAFVVVTALGADPSASVFYNRVKGEVEAALAELGFESLVILQPSLLLGDRQESRTGEHIAIVASRLLAPLLEPLRSRPIEARVVGRAAARLALEARPGTQRIHSGDLHALGA
jgi:uncharacterized protein YbjT (DUF2867 family)